MPKVHDQWTVLPHGPVEKIGGRILTVEGDIPMPLGNFPRRMTVVGLAGSRTLVWSAIALREPEMARVDALGRPAFLVVPNLAHRLDAKIFKQRYPDLQVVTPPGARAAVEEVVKVDATKGEFGDPDVDFVVVAGFDQVESALVVRDGSGTTLITNDIIGHVTNPHGIGAKIMARLFRYGVDRPEIPRTFNRFVKDRPAFAGQLREWAALSGLNRIIVSHGEPIVDKPAATLLRLADWVAS